MLHVTHKSCLKLVGAGLLAVATFVAVSVSSIAQAKPVDMQITQEVKQAVRCFSYARAMDYRHEVQKVYLQRIGKASESAGAVYALGYTEGVLDGFAYSNAEVLGGYKEAKVHAANHMYKLHGCTINESI